MGANIWSRAPLIKQNGGKGRKKDEKKRKKMQKFKIYFIVAGGIVHNELPQLIFNFLIFVSFE